MSSGTIIGKRVEIVGKHPHTGEKGVVDRAERTPVGPGLIVKLGDCPHGTDACFVFRSENIRVIEE